jgi:hypothetical protein
MLFLSAQPDDDYFIWQLELQLYNFKQLQLEPENIHVLVGYSEKRGLNKAFAKFINDNRQAKFFIYPDTRELLFYPSSLRPHIIKKHFKAYPNLVRQTIFYHDSDIIFRELPNFKNMLNDDKWYVSNARSYLDSTYLQSKGEGLFDNMCKIVGIDPKKVEKNDNNTGGAQYLLKNTTYDYWDKVEQDCVKLYFALSIYEQLNDKIIGLNPKDKNPIQAWCADMWALLWNAWEFGYQTKIHKELDFCWPHEQVSKWYSTKIYHDAGILEKQKNEYFCKSIYKHKKPYFDNFNSIFKNSCSFKYLENMKAFIKHKD